jgi:phosphatidylserine/phosphatidylglycerophosphate/cardiolipin synthase-like enzyme
MFCPMQMVATLTHHIRTSYSVVGCMAWLTHPQILNALEKVDATIVMTKHKSNRWKRHIKVKFIGRGRQLMHHKFLVGCDDVGPAWVSFGSFNATKSAMTNLENMVLVKDRTLATTFFKEFTQVLTMAK